jgi:hypothetical protein
MNTNSQRKGGRKATSARRKAAKKAVASKTDVKAPIKIGIQLGVKGAGAGELDELTRLFGEELRELDVSSVALAEGGNLPAGAKGMGLVAIGSVVVKLLGGKAFTNVIAAAKAWLARGERQVKLTVNGQTLELKSATVAQQEMLITTWMKAVSANSPVPAHG